jgi:hypothetical protein
MGCSTSKPKRGRHYYRRPAVRPIPTPGRGGHAHRANMRPNIEMATALRAQMQRRGVRGEHAKAARLRGGQIGVDDATDGDMEGYGH